MSEAEIRERLGAYLDGEVAAAEKTAIEAELARSPELRDELEHLRRTSGQLHRHFEHRSAASVDDRGEALAVERIVRMSTQELRRADILPPRRRSPFMFFAVLVTLIGAGLLVTLPYLNGEPTADELVAAAADQDFLEFDISLDSMVGGILNRVIALAPQELEAAQYRGLRLRIGPGGLSHLSLGRDPESGEARLQAGRDEVGPWVRIEPGQPIRRVANLNQATGQADFDQVLGLADRLRRVLAEARDNPRALDLVGRVHDEIDRKLWKVRMGGSQSKSDASFWFGDDGQLERIDLGPIVCRVNHDARLSRDDFRLDRILPGVAVEE